MDKKKKDIILATTDFHDVAGYAAEHAVGIAKKFGYKIVVLHVYKRKRAKITDEEAIKKLEAIANDIKTNHGLEADYIFREGDPLLTIPEVVEEVGANYMTMGTRGKTGVEYIFGNYAAKIIQSAKVPVIVVQKRHYDIGYKNIVLPIDSTNESKQIVKWGILFAKRWGAKINIFARSYNDEFHVRKTTANVKLIRKIFDENGIENTYSFSKDKKFSFGKQTIKFAVDNKADLIMATTKLDILIPGVFSGGLFSGNVDEEFIQEASQIPVLCINAQNLNIIIGGL